MLSQVTYGWMEMGEDGVTASAGSEIGPLWWLSEHRGDGEEGDYTHHRHAILQGLAYLTPFESVVELGCHRGQNLSLIRDLWPGTHLTGVDLNPRFLEAARNTGADLVTADVGDWMASPHDPPDVYVFCYVLAYLPPERAHDALYRAITRARRGVVLAEPITTYRDEGLLNPDSGLYRHNLYRVLYRLSRERGGPVKFDTQTLVTPADGLDRVLTIWTSPGA